MEAGQPVHFTDHSIFEPIRWSWDFNYTGVHTEDSSDQHPVWTFRFSGTYQVRLEVCNAVGCSDRIQAVEVELPPPVFIDDFEAGNFAAWSSAP